MVIWADYLTNTADILNASVEDGEVGYDLGDVRDDAGISVDSAPWGIDGFVSMPNLPTGTECARALYLVDGNEKVVIGTKDARWADKVGTLEPGDRAIVSKGEQRLLMKQGNESVVLYSKNQNKPTENSMMVSLCGKDGTVTIVNGGCLITMEDDGIMPSITLTAKGLMGQSFIKITPTGIQLGGPFIMLAAPAGQIGQLAPGTVFDPKSTSNGIGYTAAPGGTPPTTTSLTWSVSP